MEFTPEELNAIGMMVSAAPISGKDAKFVAALLDKVQAMINETRPAPDPAPVPPPDTDYPTPNGRPR